MPRDTEITRYNQLASLSQEERLTFHFAAWEKRGRGWDIYPYPVTLEPPFRPFLFHFAPSAPIYDDGHRPTFFSSFADRLLGRGTKPKLLIEAPEEIEPEPEPAVFYEEAE